MTVTIEDFSLRHIVPQFREFNSAVRANRARLTPYFWWARAGKFDRFKFILSGLMAEKVARIMHELPYNKKFIIRCDGKFAGAIGLDGTAQNAPRAEVWFFVTDKFKGKHVASNALKQVEKFASGKHIDKIYAYTACDNRKSQYVLYRNDYEYCYSAERTRENHSRLVWYKIQNDKFIEK